MMVIPWLLKASAIPFAAGHEIIRQRCRDLTLIRLTPDLIYDQMIGAGCARKMIFSWAGNPGVGLSPRFRDAAENGWPHNIEIEEHSHAGLIAAVTAAAAGLPFGVLLGYFGNDLCKHTKTIVPMTCPFRPSWILTAIAEVPQGARPSYVMDYYERDDTFYREWDAISQDRDRFQNWIRKNVENC